MCIVEFFVEGMLKPLGIGILYLGLIIGGLASIGGYIYLLTWLSSAGSAGPHWGWFTVVLLPAIATVCWGIGKLSD